MHFNPRHLRRVILDMAYAGTSGHIGCAFSIVELLSVLYRSYLHYPGDRPDHPNRDYMILSKGHGVMAQYACLLEKGWLGRSDFDHYLSNGTLLKGLSDSHVPGLEVTSGSLGHGLSVGVGLALAASIGRTGQRTYVVVGDGELNEGPIWEGLLFAAHHELSDLTVIVDANGFQAMGRTNDVLGLDPIESKFSGFGFETLSVDGHDERKIHAALKSQIHSTSAAPKALVARTVKGRGVPFMENDNRWHYSKLDADTYAKAVEYLSGETK